ncbi:hypothetical protein [Nocardia inohanensis]|uniref:hypothetical protein n=1 Tax=Nocardia inohanensis TaxID=209246 RepID=UPI000837306D|nr:hypothetical protein [Nocardia inohanensis]
MVDASPVPDSPPPDPIEAGSEAERLRASAAAVTTRQEFGALLSAVAGESRLSVGAVKTQLGGTRSVYDWFRGKALPRESEDARRLAALLGQALARRHPGADLAEAIYDAWRRLAEQRQQDAAVRALVNRRGGSVARGAADMAEAMTAARRAPDEDRAVAGDRRVTEPVGDADDSTPTATGDAAPVAARDPGAVTAVRDGGGDAAAPASDPTPGRHRRLPVAAALSLVIGFAAAFAIARAATAS